MLFFLFGPQGVPGEVADQNEVHRKARPFGGVRRGPAGEEPVHADEFQHGAHHAHQRAAGDEARGDQRAAVEAGLGKLCWKTARRFVSILLLTDIKF